MLLKTWLFFTTILCVPGVYAMDEKDKRGNELIEAATGNSIASMNALGADKADVNAVDHQGRNVLMRAIVGGIYQLHKEEASFKLFLKSLLDAGLDLYHWDNFGRTALSDAVFMNRYHQYVAILDVIEQLTSEEKSSLKNWLLIDHRLRNERRGLPKDLRRPIAQAICRSLAFDERDRFIRAGGLEAVAIARNQGGGVSVKSLSYELNIPVLEHDIWLQLLWPKSKKLHGWMGKSSNCLTKLK